ncbi:MAG: anti-sigma F factor [Clostridia bacterium]|nr:anti-sigma F factor [Clostridia bacterium]
MNNNKMVLKISAISENEHFARTVVGCFVLRLNPSVAQVSDIKTAVSEAVTNCIVHGYPNNPGEITIEAYIEKGNIHINIFDNGVGISNIEEALQPFYTTKGDEERSGMGFTIMQSFMDSVEVKSKLNEGTKIYMSKKIISDAV